jgi:ribosomal protein L31E
MPYREESKRAQRVKDTGPKKIATTIHLQKLVHNSVRKGKAERAIKEIVKAGQRIMGTPVVKIDQDLNSRIWYRSRANPPVRVRVVFERKAAPTKKDQEGEGELFTVAHFEDVKSFDGLKTEKVA